MSATGSDDDVGTDGMLGPAQLPQTPPFSCLLHGYIRLPNHMSRKAFIDKYHDESLSYKWRYPFPEIQSFYPLPGFNSKGKQAPIMTDIVLGVGTLIDRFGHDDTGYFAPLATPFAMRSLPPCSLNDPYHVFRVVEPLTVKAGPIAPGFEQPGLGTQYIAGKNVKELINGGKIVRLSKVEVDRLYDQ